MITKQDNKLLTKLLVRGTDTWLKVTENYNLYIQLLGNRLEKVNVPLAEHDVLMALLHILGATQQQVAKACFAAKSGVIMLLSRLEQGGLVRRETDEADARVKHAYLIEKGERLALKRLAIQQGIVNLMTSPLSYSELDTIAHTMQSLSNRLRAAKF